MKKKFGFLSAIGMSAVMLAACGGGTEDENATNTGDGGGTDYPSKPIQIIVPYSAGGGGDTVARILSDSLSKELGEQVNVLNRDGAGGQIGISEMAAAEADGYTLGVFGYPDNLILEKTGDTDFSFDSFEYLASFDDVPHALFGGPGSGFESLEDLVTYAKEKPGEVTIGESGALGLLEILAFEEAAGIDVTPIAYDGGGDLINGLLGDHIDVASSSITSADQIVDAGGTPLAYAGAERMEMFSDYPTFIEQDYDLEMGVARVLVAPEGIPEDVKTKLTEALDKIGQDEELKTKFEDALIPYRYFNNAELTEYLNSSNERLEPIVEENIESFTGGN